jgi:Protein of unknown function (DUF3489)
MQRAKGPTLAEIMEAMGWQPHTVRGFVSILGSKRGEQIESSKNAVGERTYKIASSAPAPAFCRRRKRPQALRRKQPLRAALNIGSRLM